MTDLDRTKNTEMFDNAAMVCKTVPPGFSPRQERPFIDIMWENVLGFHYSYRKTADDAVS